MKKETATAQKKKVVLPMDVIDVTPETDVEAMVSSYAAAQPKKYNLSQFKPQKAVFDRQKEVCQSVLDFRTKHPEMPLYAVLSVGISAGAYKREVFSNGYKGFDSDRAEFVLEMGKWYNEYLGIKGKPSDVTYRLITRFYNRVYKDRNVFKLRVKTAQGLDGKRGHFKELCEILGM